MFVPLRIRSRSRGGLPDHSSFVTTDPNGPDTDLDGLTDGGEVVAHASRQPAVAPTYKFLIDKGLTTYYTLLATRRIRTPTATASTTTRVVNGTDPFVPNGTELGIGD